MKKRTTSRMQLKSDLRHVAQELHDIADFDVPEDLAPEPVEEFFSLGEATPSPSRGRGQRFRVPIGWIWWPARIDPDEGASLVCERIRTLPGVEEVSSPQLDPQFRFIWQTTVVIRTSQ